MRTAALNPVTTRRAFVENGALYVRETYRSVRYTKGEETDTGYLVGLDPRTGRVRERHRLPGVARAFTRRQGAV